MIERMDKLIKKKGPNQKSFSDISKSPQFKDMLIKKVGETWFSWAGVWNKAKVKGKSIDRSSFHFRKGNGEVLGVTKNLIKLRYSEILEGPELLKFYKKIAPGKVSFKGAKKTFMIEGEWSLKNLRPAWVKKTQKVEIEMPNSKKHSTLETHYYTFDWGQS